MTAVKAIDKIAIKVSHQVCGADEAEASEGEQVDDGPDQAGSDRLALIGGAADRERDQDRERNRAEQPELVPDLEEDRLRRAGGQESGELAAQGSVEPMSREQPEGFSGDVVAPDLPRLQGCGVSAEKSARQGRQQERQERR